MKHWTIGVDVGGTEIKLGLFDEGLREKWSIPTNVSDKGANILPEVADTIAAKCRALNIDVSSLAGIGMGLPAARAVQKSAQNRS